MLAIALWHRTICGYNFQRIHGCCTV